MLPIQQPLWDGQSVSILRKVPLLPCPSLHRLPQLIPTPEGQGSPPTRPSSSGPACQPRSALRPGLQGPAWTLCCGGALLWVPAGQGVHGVTGMCLENLITPFFRHRSPRTSLDGPEPTRASSPSASSGRQPGGAWGGVGKDEGVDGAWEVQAEALAGRKGAGGETKGGLWRGGCIICTSLRVSAVTHEAHERTELPHRRQPHKPVKSQ